MTNVEARCNKSLRPRKPEGSLGRTAQDVHLDSHTAPELYVGWVGGRGRLYTYRYTAVITQQKDSSIKMVSDESHFIVSLTVRVTVNETLKWFSSLIKSQDSVHKPQPFFEEKGEPKRNRTETPSVYQPNALPLDQSGSQAR